LLVTHQNIGTATFAATPQFPLRLQFNVLGLVTFFKKAVHTFQKNCIFWRRKIAGLGLVNFEALARGAIYLLVAEIHQCFKIIRAITFAHDRSYRLSVLVKSKMREHCAKVVVVDHVFFGFKRPSMWN